MICPSVFVCSASPRVGPGFVVVFFFGGRGFLHSELLTLGHGHTKQPRENYELGKFLPAVHFLFLRIFPDIYHGVLEYVQPPSMLDAADGGSLFRPRIVASALPAARRARGDEGGGGRVETTSQNAPNFDSQRQV